MGPGSLLRVSVLSPLPSLLTNRIPRGELTQPSPSSPQQQPGVSQVHIPFPGKWDLYISRRIQATIIMVGFGGVFKVRGCSYGWAGCLGLGVLGARSPCPAGSSRWKPAAQERALTLELNDGRAMTAA